MRKDVTDDRTVTADILDAADILFLGLPEPGDAPYVLPVNFARMDDRLVIHSSRKGRKAGLLGRGGIEVGFSAVARAEAKTGEAACKFGYRFQSVVGQGRAEEITGPDERRAALDAVIAKYGAAGLPVDQAVFDKTALFAIRISRATARVKQ